MGTQDNLRVAKQIYVDFKTGNIDGLLNVLTEDVDWGYDSVAIEVFWYGMRRGHAAVREFFEIIAREVEVPVFEQDEFFASDNQVVVLSHAEFVMKRNGRTFAFPEAVHIWTFGDDGRVTRLREVADTAAALAAWRG